MTTPSITAGSSPSEARQLLYHLFTQGPGVRPPWRLFAVSRLDGTENLMPAFGIQAADLRIHNQPVQVWREFRQLVPTGRYLLWVLGGATQPRDPTGGMIVVDSQLCDKAFSLRAEAQAGTARGKERGR